MDPIPNYLSLWEIAHRWHNALPSSVDESSLTPEIRDTLLALIEATLMGVISLGESVMLREVKGGFAFPARLEWMRVKELPVELAEMYSSGVLVRKSLQAHSLSLKTVFDWCNWCGYEAPAFCIPAWLDGEPGTEVMPRAAKSRPEAEDKAKCQEIAARKWTENPSIRIAAMARDDAIHREGNGGLYTEPTLLGWLREVAPNTVKGKPGRPRLGNTPPK